MMTDTLHLPAHGTARVRLLMEALASAARNASTGLDDATHPHTVELMDTVETDVSGYLACLDTATDRDAQIAEDAASDAEMERLDARNADYAEWRQDQRFLATGVAS